MDWLDHFQTVAEVNEWGSTAKEGPVAPCSSGGARTKPHQDSERRGKGRLHQSQGQTNGTIQTWKQMRTVRSQIPVTIETSRRRKNLVWLRLEISSYQGVS